MSATLTPPKKAAPLMQPHRAAVTWIASRVVVRSCAPENARNTSNLSRSDRNAWCIDTAAAISGEARVRTQAKLR